MNENIFINKEYYEEKVFEMDWRKPILLT